MKIVLQFLLVIVVLTVVPLSGNAVEVDIDQVKKTVQYLKDSVSAGQPAISVNKLKQLLGSDDRFVLLDVRTAAEFEAGHIAGALNIERGRIEWLVPEIIKNPKMTIYVYCRTGERSGFATERLLEMGYANTFLVKDGFFGWLQAGYPVYNRHGEFQLVPGAFEKREPTVGR